MNEYRAILRDGTLMGFDVETCHGYEKQFGFMPAAGESDYLYRLRILRHLSAKDIVSWTIADMSAPVIHPQPRPQNTSMSLGVIFISIAAVGVLILMTLH